MLINQIEEIREYAKNHTMADTAGKFGVAYTTMCMFCKERNIKCAKFVKNTNMTPAELREFCKDKTKLEIAEQLGISEKQVQNILNSYGLRWKREYKAHGIKADRNEMIVYLCQKFSYESIGKEFGITRQCVEQINRMYGGNK